MTPPRGDTALNSVAVTGTDIVMQSFRSGHPHHPGPSVTARQGEKQTTPRTKWGGCDGHTRTTDASRVSHLAAQTAETTHQHPHSGTRRNYAAVPTFRSCRSGDRRDPTSPTIYRVVDRKHAAGRSCCRTSATPPPTTSPSLHLAPARR